jgi:hypothetical protein
MRKMGLFTGMIVGVMGLLLSSSWRAPLKLSQF